MAEGLGVRMGGVVGGQGNALWLGGWLAAGAKKSVWGILTPGSRARFSNRRAEYDFTLIHGRQAPGVFAAGRL